MKQVWVIVAVVAVVAGGGVWWFSTRQNTPQNNSASSSSSVSSSKNIAVGEPNPSTPVTPVSACKILTEEKIKLVYADKQFVQEENRNDTPTIYEALSSCRYKETSSNPIDAYYINLEIRAQTSVAEANRFLNGRKELDYDKKGREVSGVGSSAWLTKYPMTSGGPTLEFVKDNVYYKLTELSLKSGAGNTIETEMIELAKKLLQ